MVVGDKSLKKATDYNKGQVDAAHRILIELVNLLNEYQDEIMVIGGWTPDLMFPDRNHIGSIDVDILVNHLKIEDAGYHTIERILTANDYEKSENQYFSFKKTVTVDGEDYKVYVDIMAGKYGGSSENHRSQHFHGVKALKATGGNFAFEVGPNKLRISGKRADGANDSANINLVSVVPFLMMKAAALGRGKPKDAYDIYFVIKNYSDGIKQLAEEFKPFKEHSLVKDGIQKFIDKFGSVEHAGCIDVVSFLEPGEEQEEQELLKRDVYETVNRLVSLIQE